MQFTISSGDAINEVIAKISDAEEIAVDTEFHAENRYHPELYLVAIQIPNGDTLLIDPKESNALMRISEVMVRTPWIVHAGSQDIALLNRAFGAVPTQIFDTQIAAGLLTPSYPAPFSTIITNFSEHTPAKSATLSDWKRRPLSNLQLAYCAHDVIPLPRVAQTMRKSLIEQDRLNIAEMAFSEARKMALTPSNPDLAYLQIPSLPSLTRSDAAVLQGLASWRDRQAKHENRSAFSLISNAALHRFSRERPETRRELLQNRRISKRIVEKYGEALLQTIQTASMRPEWAWPRHIQNDTPAQDRALWLDVVARAIGREQNFSAKLLLPKQHRDAIAIEPKQTMTSLEELLGWRTSLIGPPLEAALCGNLSLSHPDKPNSHLRIRK